MSRWGSRVALMVVVLMSALSVYQVTGIATSGDAEVASAQTVPTCTPNSNLPNCLTSSGSASAKPSASSTSPKPSASSTSPSPSGSSTSPSASPSQSSPSPAPSEDESVESHISIRYNEDKTKFVGRVTSPNDDCEPDRAVVLKRDDRRVGGTATSESGRWEINLRNVKKGEYQANVKRVVVPAGEAFVTCKRDRSSTIQVV